MGNQLVYWLAALYLPRVGPQTLLGWLAHFDTIENLFHATQDEWQAAGISRAHFEALQNPNWQMVERDLAWAAEREHHIISLPEPDYPALLKEIHAPPIVLYVKGDKAILKREQVAIVGSRRPSPSGLRDAEQFAGALVKAGFTITSGLALGIDGASHRGALSAKGLTIGVMATGLNHIYPSSHRLLAQEIVEKGGALVTEFPLDAQPVSHHFPRRNRIISGLSRGTLVVEAALKSGSLITARYAAEQGREVFAIPGSIHHGLARGCHYLIQQGAKLVEAPTDIVSELTLRAPVMALSSHRRERRQEIAAGSLSTQEALLLEQIEYALTPMDVIILRSRLTAAEVSSILLSLELQGHIQSVPGGYIRAVAN